MQGKGRGRGYEAREGQKQREGCLLYRLYYLLQTLYSLYTKHNHARVARLVAKFITIFIMRNVDFFRAIYENYGYSLKALWVVWESIRERNYRLKKKNYLSGPNLQHIDHWVTI